MARQPDLEKSWFPGNQPEVGDLGPACSVAHFSVSAAPLAGTAQTWVPAVLLLLLLMGFEGPISGVSKERPRSS